MDKEDQGDARTGGAEIVAAVGGDHLRTVVAYIFIVFHIGISGADKSFEPPMAANHPMVAPGKATAVEFTPVVGFFQSGDKRNIAYIEMTVVTVQPEEMAFESLAGPVTEFGLHQVVFERHIVVELPGIVGTPEVDR